MDAETKRRLKKALIKARGTRKACEAETVTDSPEEKAYWQGRIMALDVEIESLLHRLAQEG